MNMPALDIRETPIRLHLAGSPPMDARLFLHRHGPRGEESILERLNGTEAFLPIRLQDGIRLIARSAIVWLEAERTPSQFDEDPDTMAVPLRVRLEMRTSETVDGEIRALLPETRNRPLDFLNQKERFFVLSTENETAFVNKDWIAIVAPLGEAG